MPSPTTEYIEKGLQYLLEDDEDPGMDDDSGSMDDSCPNCGTEYDDIDYEYQICSICGFNHSKK